MELTAQLETAAFRRAFDAYRESVRVVPSKAIEDQGKRLFQLVALLTPPRTLSQGKKAVKRDIERAIQPMKPAMFKDPSLRKMVREGDVEGLHAFAENASGGRWDVVHFSAQYHLDARDNRGRVRTGSGLMTPDTDELKEYVHDVQERVGMARSGWAPAVLGLGGSQPAWVTKLDLAGTFVNRAKDPIAPYIEDTNYSPWARRGDDDRVIANAKKTRAAAIMADLERRLGDAARKAELN